MGKKDIRQKTLEELDEVFADIINVLLFNGRRLVKEKDLTDLNPRSNYNARGKIREQERDVAKLWKKHEVRIALLGLENQTREDADMPIRMIGYDGAAYRDQIKRKAGKTTTQRYPVISLVLYFGHLHRWNAPKRLRECFKIDEALKPYVSDYKMNLFEIAYLSDRQVRMFKSDFKIVADYFVQMRKTRNYNPSKENIRHVEELLGLMSAITNDPRFEDRETVLQGRKRRVTMCDVLDKIEERGIKKGRAEGIAAGRAEGIAAGRAEGIAAGRAEGIAAGRAEGMLEALFGLVHDEILTVKDAAARAGISTSTFSRKMKAYKGS